MSHLNRRQFLLAAAALAVAPVAVSAANAPDPYLIVPGRSVGPITAKTTTAAALKKAFGAANVKAQPIYVGEGSSEPGFLVYGGKPDRQLEVLPVSFEGQKSLLVYIRGSATSRYRTKEGITLGTSLKQLEKLNGRPFELSGFSWDYGGTVTSWKGGKLEEILEWVTVRFDDPSTEGLTEAQASSIMGDSAKLSSMPILQKLNPKIGSLAIDLR